MTVASGGTQAFPAGPPGKSAYQSAVDNGFVGTETQWVASLQGAQGEIGPAGAPGAAGPPGVTNVAVLTSLINSLPTTLPSQPGQLWLDGGVLAVS